MSYKFKKGDIVFINGTDIGLPVSSYWQGDDDVLLESANGRFVTVDYRGLTLEPSGSKGQFIRELVEALEEFADEGLSKNNIELLKKARDLGY